MTSNRYWEQRARRDKIKVIKTSEKGIDNLKRLLKTNLEDVEKKIKEFYEKYGKNPAENLSYAEFQKYKARLRAKAKANPKDKTLQRLAKQDIPKYRIDRLRALQTDLQMQLTEATKGQEAGIYKTLSDVGKVAQATTAVRFKSVLDLEFDTIASKKMRQILSSDWSGATWSERLWKDRELVGQKVTEILEKGVPQGVSLQKMSRELKQATGQSFNNAFRLIRTETAHIDGQVTLEGYKQAKEELGYQEYIYDAFLDSRTSKICRELDGKHFKIDDAKVGVNFPPMHPNCRSTTQLDEKSINDDDIDLDDTPISNNSFSVDKIEFTPAKNLTEAKKFAEQNGVKFAFYENMSLEYANEINKALMTIPINFRPAVIMDMRTAYKTEFIPKARQRSIKSVYGVCNQLFGYENQLTKDINLRNKLMYRQGIAYNSTTFKTFDKLTQVKIEKNKLYKEKYGSRWNFNLDGRATIYHEMAHCYANNYQIPQGFEPLAKRWFQETQIGQIEKVSEAWAEAFAGYYIDNPELPEYIKEYMRGVKL